MGKSVKENIEANEVRPKLKLPEWATCGELRRHFKKHPCRDLNGRYYSYDIDGRVLGYVEYQKGVIISRKAYKKSQMIVNPRRRGYGSKGQV